MPFSWALEENSRLGGAMLSTHVTELDTCRQCADAPRPCEPCPAGTPRSGLGLACQWAVHQPQAIRVARA